jgi:pimeloyl-ACP methyl ester carboxylesterase
MIRFNHSIVEIEGLNIHFIHEKSSVPGAIPIILLHGWPGTFFVSDSARLKSTMTLSSRLLR